ncbi:hypothetical protein C8J34_104149 [Rhizobium sp. PP-F2F-G36]|nr:hypothetical protein C8J34_104149 [Rhizobium sp. PP-F2F-G36]
MSVPSYELTRLDSNNFEHLVNAIGMKVLGAGLTGFGPGADGGRDGYFEGKAEDPSVAEQWTGVWYVQSKFHAAHLSTDPQKWLLGQIQAELTAFSSAQSRRKIPDIWIIATNIEPSGVAETGCFDAARKMVAKAHPEMAARFQIWGGRKILDFLSLYPSIASYYGEFLTPGNVLKKLYDELSDSRADVTEIFRSLTVTQMMDQQYTKLEQAGSAVDNRPGIQKLYVDIPIKCDDYNGYAATTLAKTLAQVHRVNSAIPSENSWNIWSRAPRRSRVWFVKGGPGQGKSTLTQYVAQIHRAALILQATDFPILPAQAAVAEEIKSYSRRLGLWPETPRIPVTVELKDYAFWFGQRTSAPSQRMIAFLSERLTKDLGVPVLAGTLKRAFGTSRWLFIFDGLDEVPSDVKDAVSNEVVHFVDDLLVGCKCDAAIVCTSRPQGYSGQFSGLGGATVELVSLTPDQALKCATPLLKTDRSESDSRAFIEMLKEALKSPGIAEIMKSPLQAHIMAVIVRDGGRPPERRWKLFNTFYEVIKKRESNRNLPDKPLAGLLREGDKLLRAIHNRLGFELHARAETSRGATTAIDRAKLKAMVTQTVEKLQDKAVRTTVSTVMKATTERLVLVNTPESGEHVRFDIRPLQEFFAAEFLYRDGQTDRFHARVHAIASDAHWREVMHFLISALVENGWNNELAIATNVLEAIDSGDTVADRAFNRRLAKGARITARLLAEGVLEEDKQVRSRFLNAIMPIAAQVNLHELLERKLQTHSLAWIQDALLIALREQALPETIGAAICLGHLIPDRDRRSREVAEFVTKAGSEYIAYFLYAIHQHADFEAKKFHKWVVAIACDFLSMESWHQFSEEVVGAACDIAGAHPDTLRKNLGLDKDSIVPEILCASLKVDGGRRIPRNKPTFHVLHGAVEMHMEPPHPSLDCTLWDDTVWKSLSTLSGIFGAIFKLYRLIKIRSDAALVEFVNCIGGKYEKFALLPFPARFFIRESVSLLPPNPDAGVDGTIEPFKPGWARYTFMVDYRKDVDLRGIALDNPTMLLPILALEEFGDSAKTFLEDASNANLLERGIRASAAVDILNTWSLVSELQYEKQKWLDLVLALAVGPVVRKRYRRSLVPLKISLPTESVLLPHIVGALVDAVETEVRRPYQLRENNRSDLVTWTGHFIDRPVALKKIAFSTSVANHIRVAAFVLYHLHPKITVRESPDFLNELYDSNASTWMLPGIAMALFDDILKREPQAFSQFALLLERSTSDYFGRASLQSAFKAWREASFSPVTTAGKSWVN